MSAPRVDVDRVAPPYLRQLFRRQLEVIAALRVDALEPRYVAATCGRRAGKTVTAAAALCWAAQHAGWDESIAYGARTRRLSKILTWNKVKQIVRSCYPQWRINEADLAVYTDRGASIYLVGFDKADDIEKMRGMKLRLFVADEPATYAHQLGYLLTDVVGPALGDVRGSILLCGTPGMVCVGPWYEISTGRREAWRRYHWTILNNPFFPDPQTYLENKLKEEGWTRDAIPFRREYMAEWVADDSVLVYRFDAGRNVVANPPQTRIHTIGIDFGMNDECAWVVWGSEPHSRDAYVVHAEKRGDLLPEEAAKVTAELARQYDPDKIVGDAGGLGKPYVEQFNRRYADVVRRRIDPAEKSEKRANIELMNSELCVPRLFVRSDCYGLIDEWSRLVWKDDRREVEHDAYPNHLADAALYGWRAHRAYAAQPAPAPPKHLQPDDPEWIEREEREFREAESTQWWER